MILEMTVNSALDDYYEYCKCRVAENTWRGHQGRLEHWRQWIVRETQTDVYLSEIADDRQRYMERYFNRLRPPAYAPSSFNNFRQYFREFWAYCRGRGWVNTNPMMHIDPLRVPKRQRLRLSPIELIGMLDDAAPRDRIALAVGRDTLIRATDAMNLRVGDVDLATNTITVFVKKGQEELLFPITAELRVELLRWLGHYAEVMGLAGPAAVPNTWTLIPAIRWLPNNVGSKAAGGYFRYRTGKICTHPEVIVHRALEKLGHPTTGEGFHTLRRSGARAMYDLATHDGVPSAIRVVQKHLGHARQKTTEDYLGISPESEARDTMLRGKSFMTRAAEVHAARNRQLDAGDNLNRRDSA